MEGISWIQKKTNEEVLGILQGMKGNGEPPRKAFWERDKARQFS